MACLLESGWNSLFFPGTEEVEAEVASSSLLVPTHLFDLQPFPQEQQDSNINNNAVQFIDVSAEELWFALITDEISFVEQQNQEEEDWLRAINLDEEEEQPRPDPVVQLPPAPLLNAVPPVTRNEWSEDSEFLGLIGSLFEEEIYDCPICLESYTHGFVKLSGCKHGVCIGCLRESIRQAMVQTSSPPACPMYQCGCRLSQEELLKYTPRETLLSMDRQFMYQRLDAFVCAGTCGMMVFIDKNSSDNDNSCNQYWCPKCSHSMCGQCHASNHPGTDCKNSGVTKSLPDFLNEANTNLCSSWTSCPLCHQAIFRSEGCAHITCVCRCNFCFYCRRKWRLGNKFRDQHHEECPVRRGGIYAKGDFPIEYAIAVPSNKEDWEAFGATQPIPISEIISDDDDIGFGLFD